MKTVYLLVLVLDSVDREQSWVAQLVIHNFINLFLSRISYCTSLLTKHVTHDRNIMRDILIVFWKTYWSMIFFLTGCLKHVSFRFTLQTHRCLLTYGENINTRRHKSVFQFFYLWRTQIKMCSCWKSRGGGSMGFWTNSFEGGNWGCPKIYPLSHFPLPPPPSVCIYAEPK